MIQEKASIGASIDLNLSTQLIFYGKELKDFNGIPEKSFLHLTTIDPGLFIHYYANADLVIKRAARWKV